MSNGAESTGPVAGETVFLGLGGNQGDRMEHLRAGVTALAAVPGVSVVRVSGVYETDYVGTGQQDRYLNACVEIRSTLEPGRLLAALQGIEERRGRRPDTHLKPRPLDLDILLFGSRTQHDPALAIPHPSMRERAFVLVPLAEIAAGEIFPDSGETVAEACAKIRGKTGSGVELRTGLTLQPNHSDPVQGG